MENMTFHSTKEAWDWILQHSGLNEPFCFVLNTHGVEVRLVFDPVLYFLGLATKNTDRCIMEAK